ncbi:MAG: nucleoside hydrolase [Alphaproteobacteria bacterium]|nr:nucleoside hydrolase [Alphaproteobacteria bacterium]
MPARSVIIDCDPGTDDALALLLAFGSPELDIRAITVAGGNVGLERTLQNALSLAALASSAAPVHGGADRPLLGTYGFAPEVHGDDGLGGIALPAGGVPNPALAADAIRDILRKAAEPVTLVGIGPVTNIALALITEPPLAAKIAEIVLMAGSWGEGNTTPSAEFNVWNDPEAFAVLLACDRPLVLAPLELTAHALVTDARIAALRARGGGACLRTACDILDSVPRSRRFGGLGFALHDPCTIAWLLRPELFTTRACPVLVDLVPGPNRGRTIIDRWDRSGLAPNAAVLETLDADGFFALLGDRLAALP